MTRHEPEKPAIGTLMVDIARSLIGEYRGEDAQDVYLRPLGGGREWTVSRAYLRLATDADRSNINLAGRAMHWRDEAEAR